MGKENWLKNVMQQKEKLERIFLKCRQWQNFLNVTYMSLSFLNGSLFRKLKEYNQFNIYGNVLGDEHFPMRTFVPL